MSICVSEGLQVSFYLLYDDVIFPIQALKECNLWGLYPGDRVSELKGCTIK